MVADRVYDRGPLNPVRGSGGMSATVTGSSTLISGNKESVAGEIERITLAVHLLADTAHSLSTRAHGVAVRLLGETGDAVQGLDPAPLPPGEVGRLRENLLNLEARLQSIAVAVSRLEQL